jgi:hypothetical protein
MSRPTFLSRISEETREELNRKLRSTFYSGFLEVAEWLKGLGFNASKSSVHRYAVALRESDGMNYASGLTIAAKARTSISGLCREEQIFMEIGRLRVMENELLVELSKLRDDPELRDDPDTGNHS